MVISITRSISDREDPVVHRYSLEEPGYRHDGRKLYLANHRSDPCTKEVSYRLFKPQQATLSSQEAIKNLNKTTNDALRLFQGLQSSFTRETSLIGYVDTKVLDYIWQDKLASVEEDNTEDPVSEGRGGSIITPRHPPDTGVRVTIKDLRHCLDEAISATANEMQRSAADNRSLAEKLNRSYADINNSLKDIWKRRKEAEILITELELLHVLLKRHGGGKRSDQRDNSGSRCPRGRSSSYKHMHVGDGHDDVGADACYSNDGSDDEENHRRHEIRNDQTCAQQTAEYCNDWGAQGTYTPRGGVFGSMLILNVQLQEKKPAEDGTEHAGLRLGFSAEQGFGVRGSVQLSSPGQSAER
ncbi:MAG: hypothetical protein Q9163_006012 [Psora crenata]